MARRIYSAIEKFKRVEVALRSATNGFRAALAEIDRALAGPRTAEELALLRSIRDQTARLQDESRIVIGRLYQEVQG